MSVYVPGKLLHLCPILCDPVDHSLPGSSVHSCLCPGKNIGLGCHVFQWIEPSSLMSSALVGGFFTTSATWWWLPTPVFLPGEFHGQRSVSLIAFKDTLTSCWQSWKAKHWAITKFKLVQKWLVLVNEPPKLGWILIYILYLRMQVSEEYSINWFQSKYFSVLAETEGIHWV